MTPNTMIIRAILSILDSPKIVPMNVYTNTRPELWIVVIMTFFSEFCSDACDVTCNVWMVCRDTKSEAIQ